MFRMSIATRLMGYLLLAGIVPPVGLFLVRNLARHRHRPGGSIPPSAGLRSAGTSRFYYNQIGDLASNIAGNEAIGAALSTSSRQGGNKRQLRQTQYVRADWLHPEQLRPRQGTRFDRPAVGGT